MCKVASQQLLAFCALTLFYVNFVAANPTTRPCTKVFKCSYIDAVIWATDATAEKCYVWRNICHLMSENCRRQNNYVKELTKISQAECQKKCANRVCTADYTPICAEYNGIPSNFSNTCAMEDHICRTGKTYVLYSQGECQT